MALTKYGAGKLQSKVEIKKDEKTDKRVLSSIPLSKIPESKEKSDGESA